MKVLFEYLKERLIFEMPIQTELEKSLLQRTFVKGLKDFREP